MAATTSTAWPLSSVSPTTAIDDMPHDGKIRVRIVSINQETMVVDLYGITLDEANSFRRENIESVIVMGIDGQRSVGILINTSDITDEVLQHRMGMIPFASAEVEKFNYPDTCPCRNWRPVATTSSSSSSSDPTIASVVASSFGCDKCRVIYTLDLKNVSATERRNVTTLDLKCESPSGTIGSLVYPVGGDAPFAPLTAMAKIKAMVSAEKFAEIEKLLNQPPSLHLLPLLPGQQISMVCMVIKGSVRRSGHHKFQAVSLVGLKSPAYIGLNHSKLAKLTPAMKHDICAHTRHKWLEYDEKRNRVSVRESKPLCQACLGSDVAVDCCKDCEDVMFSIMEKKKTDTVGTVTMWSEKKTTELSWYRSIVPNHSQKAEEKATGFGQTDAIIVLRDEIFYRMTINGIGSLRPEEIFLSALKSFSARLLKTHRNLAMAQQGKIPELLEKITPSQDRPMDNHGGVINSPSVASAASAAKAPRVIKFIQTDYSAIAAREASRQSGMDINDDDDDNSQ
jgi:hypothetical protein